MDHLVFACRYGHMSFTEALDVPGEFLRKWNSRVELFIKAENKRKDD